MINGVGSTRHHNNFSTGNPCSGSSTPPPCFPTLLTIKRVSCGNLIICQLRNQSHAPREGASQCPPCHVGNFLWSRDKIGATCHADGISYKLSSFMCNSMCSSPIHSIALSPSKMHSHRGHSIEVPQCPILASTGFLAV